MTRPSSKPTKANDTLDLIGELDRKVHWLSAWTIHNANHLRESRDGLKVGGHQASCASMASIMSALYFSVLGPDDRVAVKPHASPVFHAIQYLYGRQSLDQLQRFRGFGGANPIPRAPRMAKMSTFPPARSASVSRSPPSPLWPRTICWLTG